MATPFTVSSKYVPILAKFMAVKDTRWYLNGFYARPHPLGGAVLVATDGSKLCAIHDEEATIEDEQIRALEKRTISACKRKGVEWCQFEAEHARVELPSGKLVDYSESAPIDAKYPDWVPVVSKYKPAAEVIQPKTFQGDLLAVVGGMGPVSLHEVQKGDDPETALGSPLFLRFGHFPEMIAVVMPMRNQELYEIYPDWFGAL